MRAKNNEPGHVSCHAGSFERPDGAAGNRARLRSAPRAAAGVWYAKTVLCRAVMSESVAGICGVLTLFRNHYESWWDAMPDAGTSTNPDDLDDYSPATLRRPYSLYEDDEMAVRTISFQDQNRKHAMHPSSSNLGPCRLDMKFLYHAGNRLQYVGLR